MTAAASFCARNDVFPWCMRYNACAICTYEINTRKRTKREGEKHETSCGNTLLDNEANRQDGGYFVQKTRIRGSGEREGRGVGGSRALH